MSAGHLDECDKSVYGDEAICTCSLVAYGDYDDDEPANMAELEDGGPIGELW